MTRVYGSLSSIDWTNRAQVIAYADKLGPGMVVYKRADRRNYNITHADRYLLQHRSNPDREVVHLTR